jgi:hypothetical protein
MSRKANFNDQPKAKKVPLRTIRTHAHELSDLLSNRPYEGPGDNAITNQKFGRSSGTNN